MATPCGATTILRPCALAGVYLTPREQQYCASLCWEEEWCVISLGHSLMYTLPNFPALTVELRVAKVQRSVGSNKFEVYDVFIRNDSSYLVRTYPATLTVKYAFAVEVHILHVIHTITRLTYSLSIGH